MTGSILLTIALLGPPDAYRDAPAAQIAAAPWTAEQLREMFRDQTRRTARIRDVDPDRVAPDLMLLYGALHRDNPLRGSELVDMRSRTEDRLERVRERLLRERLRLQREIERELRRQRSRTAGAATFGAAMPGLQAELANAQALIDVITETIEPQTWQINGGRGSITYFSPLHVLVVRNNHRVHEQLGGALGDLGR